MRRASSLFLSLSLLVASGAACKKEESTAKPGGEAAKPGAEAAKPGAEPAKPGEPGTPGAEPAKPAGPAAATPTTGWVPMTFEDLPKVSFDVPPETSMVSAVTNEFVQVSKDDFIVSVGVEKYPHTYAEDVDESQKDEDCTFTSWVKKEEIADGWVLAYQCKVSDEKPINFKVQVQRTIAGTRYECSWDRLPTTAAADAVIKSCLSVKPSGK